MKAKKIIIGIVSAFFLLTAGSFAAEAIVYQNYEIDSLLRNIDKPCAPVVTDDYIIFTADVNNRFVGIAFDFENYQIIHRFQVLTTQDEDGNVTRKHMFYCYNRQHKFTTLKYRLVIDGLWTADPLNPNKEYDDSVNLYFSKVEDPGSIKSFTSEKKKNVVHFIYKGESGLDLRLAGTFTNWDPWIYKLKETTPGFYELELPLTRGTYYYNYYIGLKPVLDNTNPEKAYTNDGRTASVIKVN